MKTLASAKELAQSNKAHFPNETPLYRQARNELLEQEIELRRQIERVSALRRQLPPGGEVTRDYRFESEDGPVKLADLFGQRDTLIVYSYMFGPRREKMCPMCASFLNSIDLKLPAMQERVAFAAMARSPIERQLDNKRARGWKNMPIYADTDGAFTRDYVHPDDADIPAYNVFTRRDGKLRHFYAGEMSGDMADPDQDPRGAPDLDILWTLLDTTPEGRGADWYPGL